MKIFKFKDQFDGKTAFIIARRWEIAEDILRSQTSIPFARCDEREFDQINQTGFIIKNDILPF